MTQQKYTAQEVLDAVRETRNNVGDDLPEDDRESEMYYRIGAVSVLRYLD